MEYTELNNKSEKELHDILAEKRTALRALRFKAHDQQLKDVREIRETRKIVARILTSLKGKHVKKSNA